MIKLRILRWGFILDYPSKHNIITRVLTRERRRWGVSQRRGEVGQKRRFVDAPLLALKMEEGP